MACAVTARPRCRRCRRGRSSVVAGGRIARLDRLAAVAQSELERNDDVLASPAPLNDDARAVATARSSASYCSWVNCAMRAVPRRCRTSASPVAPAPSSRARSRRPARTPPPRARAPMSPGPKQIAGIPASLSSAASVHAVMPSMRDSLAARRRARRRARARSARRRATSLGACENVTVTSASKRRPTRRDARARASQLALARRPASRRESCGARCARRTDRDRSTCRCRLRSATRAPTAGRAADARASAARRRRCDRAPRATSPACRIASTPRSQRLPCAARPCVVDVDPDEAECAGMIASRVGSVTIAASARTPRSIKRARADALELLVGHRGDDDLAVERVVRGARRGGAHRGDAGSSCPPSRARRSARRARRASHGACVIPSMPTTSRCPLNIKLRAAGAVRCARRRSAGPAPRPRRSTRNPHVAKHVGERARDARFARTARNERRISRIDAHELARQRDGVAARYVHRSTPCIVDRERKNLAERRDRGAHLRRRGRARAISEHATAARRAERLGADGAGVACARAMISSIDGVGIAGCSDR